jgi:hypothetical protein
VDVVEVVVLLLLELLEAHLLLEMAVQALLRLFREVQ